MEYSDISRVNSEINMIDLKGKNYAMVTERVNAFRKIYPDGFITSEIISHDGTNILMKATAGHYENGQPVILSTGFAQETKGRGLVNGTSYVENCETSAVGRALGMIALGINGGGICSAEELVNATIAQEQIREEEKASAQPPIPDGADMAKANKVPAPSPVEPVGNYIRNEVEDIRSKMGIDTYINAKLQVVSWVDSLVKSKVIPKVDWKAITMEQAHDVFDAIRKTYKPGEVT